MLIEEAIRSQLLADAAVAALVTDRVYPKKLPQGPTFPAVVYHRVGTGRAMSQAGVDGLAEARFQFDCHARTYAQARELAEKLRLALVDFQGSMGGVGGVQVDGVFHDSELDDYDDDFQVYTYITDLTFLHQEARPA